MTGLVVAWTGLLLGLTGIGAILSAVLKMVGAWGGGLR